MEPPRHLLAKASLCPLLPISVQDEIGNRPARRLILDNVQPGAFQTSQGLHPVLHRLRNSACLKQGSVGMTPRDGRKQPILLTGGRPFRAKPEARQQGGFLLTREEVFYRWSRATLPHRQAQIEAGRATTD